MKKKRLKTSFISDDGVKDPTFIKVAGEAAEGAYASGPMDTSSNPLNKAAVQAHKGTHNSDPGAFYVNAYSAMLAMANAVAKADSTDLAAMKEVLQAGKVDTPIGSISFDERGDTIGYGFSVYEVKDGVWVELK